MPNSISEGDLVDIYYILPHGCFKDVGVVESVNSLYYISLLAPHIIPHIEPHVLQYSAPLIPCLEGVFTGLAVTAILDKKDRIRIEIEKGFRKLSPKRHWPIFFSELLKREKEVQNQFKYLTPSKQIGKQPPSADIYSRASKELWSIQVTYSEALRAELRATPGLSPLIDSCKNNEDLVAKICIADPEYLLPTIAEAEINAIYGEAEGENIQSKICSNAYPKKSLEKFLHPYDIDYLRKLNDTYAALRLLEYNSKEAGVGDQIEFYTYANNSTLRATFVYGELNIVDFVDFPENWIGMTGTMVRCEADGTAMHNKIFEGAEKEREKLGLTQRHDLIETIKNELIEKMGERGLDGPSSKDNITKEKVISEYYKINKIIYKKSYSVSEERRKFLQEIDKKYKSPEIIVLRRN